MKRLGTRLVLAMLVVALFSASVIVLSQYVGARLHFASLPADVQADIARRNDRRPPRDELSRGQSPRDDLSDDESAASTDASQRPPTPPPGPPPDFVNRDDFVRGLADVQDYQRRATFVGLGLAALLATLIAVYLARSISKPIERVSNAAALVAEGDLSARVPAQTGSVEVEALTQNFNTMALSLQQGEQQRRAMIADIAHELRTPLAAMKLRFQGLEDGLIPFDEAQVQRLHAQTDLLTRLVQDLRTLSLADAGQLSLQKRETDMVALLSSICDSYSVKEAEAEVGLEFNPAEPTLFARIDPDRITQVIANLLDNALRVTPAGGTVTVSLHTEGETVHVRIADTGPGMSQETLDHLFDRFFQDRDTKGSSGLGLAIVQALVKLHGGEVKAGNWSQDGSGGAQFDLSLPRLSPRADK